MNIKSLCKLVAFCFCWPIFASAESAEGILPQSLIVSLQGRELFEYRCPHNMQCQLRCIVDQKEAFSYQNVLRAEMVHGHHYWAFGVVRVDSLGKGHKAIGFVPEPAACVLDDLEFVTTIPIVDGALNRTPDEVIFDLTPSN
ncbi:MAG: hypothetical protein ACI82A_000685 [Candidatus Azotimanducaceae bacterium]|jgi:hypothetical protein